MKKIERVCNHSIISWIIAIFSSFFGVQCVAILIGAFNSYRLVTLTHLSMSNKVTDIKTQCDIELDNFIRIYMSSCRHWNNSHLHRTISLKSMFKTVNRMIPKWTNTFYIASHRYKYIEREEKMGKRARTHWKTNELIYIFRNLSTFTTSKFITQL